VLSAQCASDLKARGEPLACYEAALLVENGLAGAFSPLVVVAASEATEALARIRAQMPLAAKVAVAAIVIQNDESRDALRARADAVLAEVCTRASVPIARYPLPSGGIA
jgi:dephospho-CoA kinase